MTTAVHVVGVGMIPFTKPGRSATYSEMGEQAARAALVDGGVDYTQIQQAYVGYVYGDSTVGPGRAVRAGADRHSDRQCEQQLLDRFVGVVPGAPGGRDRRRRLRAGARLRADGARRAGPTVQRPARARSPGSTTAATRLQGCDAARADGGAVLRRRRARPTPKSTAWTRRCSPQISVKARKHAADNPYAVFSDPVTAEEVLASPHDLRPADPAAVLPAHLRRGRGDRVQRGVRRATRPQAPTW